MSTFHGLEVGKRGITTAQTQLNTTGHNMTNAATPGYSRQSVGATSSTPTQVFTTQSPNGQLGTGVLTDSITRLRDQFLDSKFWGQSAQAGDLSMQASALGELEKLMQGSSDGNMQKAMQDVWDAWETVITNPNDSGSKAVLNERFKSFVETASHLENEINAIESRLNEQEVVTREQANSLLISISGLNDVIYRSGGKDNDAMDQRDRLIDQLSGLVGLRVTPGEKGMISLQLQNGTGLIAGKEILNSFTSTTQVDSGALAGISKVKETIAAFKNNLQELNVSFTAASNPLSSQSSTRIEEQKEKHHQLWQGMIGELGTRTNSLNRARDTAILAKNGTEQDRQSVMGVSLDEEMSNLIKYQHAYNAAARLVSTTDQLLDTIINRMGV